MYEEYYKAKRLGDRAYRKAVVSGRYPYLPALEDFLPKSVNAEIPAGVRDIPLDQVVGTRTRGRQEAFADNFMPILDGESEFAVKWSLLYLSLIHI